MSYGSDSRSIEKPLRKIIEGIDEYLAAVYNRIEDGGWQEEHLQEIESLGIELTKLKGQMIRLAN